MRRWIILGAGYCCLAVAGCAVSRPGDLAAVSATSTMPRAGNVYFIRGFMGWVTAGLDDTAAAATEAGLCCHVYSGWQWSELGDRIIAAYQAAPAPEPIVLVGHSFGADEVLKIARRMQDAGLKVDLIVTLDPVVPIEVPDNVTLTLNYYQSNGFWDNFPWWRGIPLEKAPTPGLAGTPETSGVRALAGDAATSGAESAKSRFVGSGTSVGGGELVNMNVRTDRTDLLEPDTTHRSMPHNLKLRKQIIEDLLAICPPRAQWAAMPHASVMPTTAPAD
jgi:pimeloyl-ACP methyl ester carboxylesterase